MSARKHGKRTGITTPLAIGVIAIIVALSSIGYAYTGPATQVGSVENKLSTVQAQQDSQKSSIDSIKTALSSLAQQSSVTDVQNKLNALQTQMTSLGSLQTQISSIRDSLASAQKQVDSLVAAAKLRQTTPQSRDFWIVTTVLNFNETAVGIPHDTFYPGHMVVNQGDTVTIHFYNTEDEPEHHNFVMVDYNISVDLAQGQHKDITFTADKAGTFVFLCSFHQPTMRGELVVLPSS